MRIILIHIVFLFSFLVVEAQEKNLRYEKERISVKKFDEEKLENYKNKKDFQYQYVKRTETWVEKTITWLKNRLYEMLQWLFGEKKAVGVFAFLAKIFPYVIAILMLLLLLKVFLNVHTDRILSRTNRKTSVKITEDEEIIQHKDIKALITKAINDNDFRLAIRYHYLYILQALEKNKLIVWEQQKTNHEYEREIKDSNLKNHFKNVTYLYDFVWYGNFSIDKGKYKQAAQQFSNFEKVIQ